MVVRDYRVKHVFIDRERELTILKDLLTRMRNTKGQVVVINGEHGIGKTRLIEEFMKFAETEKVQVRIGSCKSTESHSPYQSIIEALDYNLQMSSKLETPEERSGIRELDTSSQDQNNGINNSLDPELNNIDTNIQPKPLGLIPFVGTDTEEEISLTNEFEPPTSEPPVVEALPMGLIPATLRVTEVGEIKKGQANLFKAMGKQLFQLAQNSPVVFFIDDLHWASGATLDFLDYLIDQIPDLPIMLIFGICPEELDVSIEKKEKIDKMIQRLNHFEFFTAITLERFAIENVNLMLQNIFSREDIAENFINQIYQKTEGNPLFIEDVLQALIEEDVIDVSSYVWQPRLDVKDLIIPTTTRERLIARLRRLKKEDLKVLGYAAVIGREFSYDMLKEVTEFPDEQILDSLDALLDAKLIHEDLSSDIDVYRYDNPLIQEIAYQDLNRSRRKFLHTKVGTLIEKQNQESLGNLVFDLADHFSKGTDHDKALKYLMLAGKHATSIYALDDARRYYLTALEILNKFRYTIQIQRNEIELLSNLGQTNKMLGDWDQALEYLRPIPNLVEKLRNEMQKKVNEKKSKKEEISTNWIQLKLADTYRNLGELMAFKSDWKSAEKNYKKSLIISQEIDDYHGLAKTEWGRGYLEWRQGDYSKALEHYDICIDFATKINDIPVIAVTYIDMGNIYNYTGDWDKAVKFYNESIGHLEKIGWIHEMGRAFNGLGEIYAKQENWLEAIKHFKKCDQLSIKIGDFYNRGWALLYTAECYARMNQFDKAMERCKAAEEILTQVNDRVGLGLVSRNYGIIFHFKEDWKTSEKYFTKSIKQLKRLNVPFEFSSSYMEYGLMLFSKGDYDDAKKRLEFSLKIFKEMNAKIRIKNIENVLRSDKLKLKQDRD